MKVNQPPAFDPTPEPIAKQGAPYDPALKVELKRDAGPGPVKPAKLAKPGKRRPKK